MGNRRPEIVDYSHVIAMMKFNETDPGNMDYQWLSDELLEISGASFVLMSLFDREQSKLIVCGFSGLSNRLRQTMSPLEHSLGGKIWDVDNAEIEGMKSKKLIRMGILHEFGSNHISSLILELMENNLKPGDCYSIGISSGDEILGSFLLIIQEGKSLGSPELVEQFAAQVGIMLCRKKDEEVNKKVDKEYRTAFDGSQDAMFLVNVQDESKFTYYMINKGYEIDAGISAETVKGLTPRDIYGEYFGKQVDAHYIDCIAAKKPVTYEESLMVDGNMKVWHTLLSPIIKDGKVLQIVGSSRNITQLKQWEDEIARERQLFKVTLKSIGDAVITTDTENRIVMLNNAAEALTGWSQEEAAGRLLSEVMKTTLEDKKDILEFYPGENTANGGRQTYYEILESKDGNNKIISSNEASIRDDGGNTFGKVIIFRDVTLEKQRKEEVRYLGYHDSLTGLYNRAYFEEAMRRLDDDKHLPLGLIMGDSNGLKMINDVFGHAEGDKLLKSITDIFRSICGNEGIVARVGGDEFAIILPNTCTEKMNDIMSRIKQQCNAESSEPICASIALGAAVKSEAGQELGEIYKLAEDRMYNNKLIESKSIRSSIIASLKKTLEERTHETEAHGQRLKELAARTGRLLGLYDNEMDDLSLLAMLHDIGKIAIPDFILGKSGSLTQEEWRIMKGHCEIGYRIAVASPELAHIAGLILSHHERWDGNGYPQGLKGEEIPLLSRIIAIVDSYDAMTNDRSYHRSIREEDALEEIERCSGTQFDPFIVEKVVKVISNRE